MKYVIWAIFAVCLTLAAAARIKAVKNGNFCGGSCSRCFGCCGKDKTNDKRG